MSEKHENPGFDGFDAEDFVGGVLGRTSGSACDRASEQLDDLMGDRLGEFDRQLVQAHLENCAPCQELAVTVGWLNPLLPQMAEIDPGPAFLTQVLAQTSKAQLAPIPAEHPTGLAGLMDRVGRWWETQIVRPEFAMQAAYVATVLLVILTTTPGSPLRGVPGRALQVVTAGPQNAPVIGPAMIKANAWVEDNTNSAVNAGREKVGNRWQRLEHSLTERAERTAPGRQELQLHLKTAVGEVQERDLSGLGYELLASLRAWNVVWDRWWHEAETPNDL